MIFGSSVAVIGTHDREQAAHATAAVLETVRYPVHCWILPPGSSARAAALPAAARALTDLCCDVLLTLAPPPSAVHALRCAVRGDGLAGWVHADPVGVEEGRLLQAAAEETGVRYEYAPVPLGATRADPPAEWRPVLLALGPHVALRRSGHV